MLAATLHIYLRRPIHDCTTYSSFVRTIKLDYRGRYARCLVTSCAHLINLQIGLFTTLNFNLALSGSNISLAAKRDSYDAFNDIITYV